MATSVTTQMPPPYIVGIGEDFSKYFTGKKPITDSPFYVDPSSFTGDKFVAGQDPLTIQAQKLAGTLVVIKHT